MREISVQPLQMSSTAWEDAGKRKGKLHQVAEDNLNAYETSRVSSSRDFAQIIGGHRIFRNGVCCF